MVIIRSIYKVEPPTNKVANTRRVERTLKLIVFTNNNWRTIKECSKLLNVHSKSIHRYFNMLVSLGFDIEKTYRKNESLYKINNVNEFFKSNKI